MLQAPPAKEDPPSPQSHVSLPWGTDASDGEEEPNAFALAAAVLRVFHSQSIALTGTVMQAPPAKEDPPSPQSHVSSPWGTDASDGEEEPNAFALAAAAEHVLHRRPTTVSEGNQAAMREVGVSGERHAYALIASLSFVELLLPRTCGRQVARLLLRTCSCAPSRRAFCLCISSAGRNLGWMQPSEHCLQTSCLISCMHAGGWFRNLLVRQKTADSQQLSESAEVPVEPPFLPPEPGAHGLKTIGPGT